MWGHKQGGPLHLDTRETRRSGIRMVPAQHRGGAPWGGATQATKWVDPEGTRGAELTFGHKGATPGGADRGIPWSASWGVPQGHMARVGEPDCSSKARERSWGGGLLAICKAIGAQFGTAGGGGALGTEGGGWVVGHKGYVARGIGPCASHILRPLSTLWAAQSAIWHAVIFRP